MTTARIARPVAVALALAASMLACAPWLRGFDDAVLLPHLFVATAIAFGVPMVGAYVAPRAGWCVAAASAPLFVVYATTAVLRDPTGVGLVTRALTQGGARLLSSTMPFAQPEWLVVVPVAACWVTGALAGESLARGKGIGVPVVVWVTSFALAYAVTVDGADSATGTAVSLAGVAGAFVLARRWSIDNDPAVVEGEPLPATRLVVGGAGLAVVVTVAAATPALPAFDAEPARPQRTPVVDEATPLTPVRVVAQMRADAVEEDRTLFVVETDAPSSGYIALAELDAYDGDAWRFHRTFAPTGGRVPASAPVEGHEVTQRYRIEDLDGLPWMPYLPTARFVAGIEARYDAATGMVVPSAPLPPGTRYTLRSLAVPETLARIPAEELLGAGASSNPRDMLPPVAGGDELRAAVDALEDELGATRTHPVEFVRALTERFQTYARTDPAHHSSDHSSAATGRIAAGTSLGDVLNAVVGKREGTPEQYATIVALVARDARVPSRLVTGFRLVDSSSAEPLPAGRYEVRASDAWTWVEIATARGWVVADPTPDSTDVTTPTTAGASAGETTTTVPSTAVAEQPQGAVAPAPRVARRAPTSFPLRSALAIVTGVIVAGVVVLPLSYRVRRALRRRARRTGSARQRVLGAWHETLESLAEVVDEPLHALTAGEVAAFARGRFGGRVGNCTATVGSAADIVLFAPAITVGDADARRTWDAAIALRRCLRSARPRRARVRAALRVRRVALAHPRGARSAAR